MWYPYNMQVPVFVLHEQIHIQQSWEDKMVERVWNVIKHRCLAVVVLSLKAQKGAGFLL